MNKDNTKLMTAKTNPTVKTKDDPDAAASVILSPAVVNALLCFDVNNATIIAIPTAPATC